MSVQRWTPNFIDFKYPGTEMRELGTGEWLRYADHVAALMEERVQSGALLLTQQQQHETALAEALRSHSERLVWAFSHRTLTADDCSGLAPCPKCSGLLGHASRPRTLTADDPEPAEWSIVRDRFGVAFQLYLGWRSPDAFYMLWPDFIAARGPVTLIHDGGQAPQDGPKHWRYEPADGSGPAICAPCTERAGVPVPWTEDDGGQA